MKKEKITEHGEVFTINIYNTGTVEYLNSKGLLHRNDNPAIITAMGSRHWYHNGQKHREDGPASIYWNGEKSFWLNGKSYSKAEFLMKQKDKIIIKDEKKFLIDGRPLQL